MATTNAMIIELYKAENNITCQLHTFAKWNEMGYKVKKGEKSQHKITIWKGCNKKVVRDGEEITTNKVIMKTAYFFTENQVEKVDYATINRL